MFGLLNLSIVIPQIIVTFVVGSMRANIENGLSWVLVIAGIAMGIASILALLVQERVRSSANADTDKYNENATVV